MPGARRTVDIAFTRAPHGRRGPRLLWHGCQEHGNQPRVNAAHSRTKLARNRQRDANLETALTPAG